MVCLFLKEKELLNVFQAHTRYYICEKFLESAEELQAGTSEGVGSIVNSLCRLYLTYHITINQGDFLRVS